MARRDRRRETTGAFAASILVHIALLIVLARQVAPGPRTPAPVEPDVQLQLVAQPPPEPGSAEPPRVSHRPPRPAVTVQPRVAPRPSLAPPARAIQSARPAPPRAQPAPPSAPSASVASTPAPGASAGSATASGGSAGSSRWTVQGGEPGEDGVRKFLRATVGCSHEEYVGLTPQERASCDRRVGHDARVASPGQVDVIPAAKREYYEAVQQAYQAIHDPRPIYDAKGNQTAAGHPPTIGCKLGGKGTPANSLKAGPCFVAPPQGVLTEESAVPKPY